LAANAEEEEMRPVFLLLQSFISSGNAEFDFNTTSSVSELRVVAEKFGRERALCQLNKMPLLLRRGKM